jgi:hypothetical protein
VPWLGGRHARLHVVPGSEQATLTITLDDGSAAETVTAPVTLANAQAGPSVGLRSIDGDFALAAGRLSLYVEWSCSDEFDAPKS